MKTLEYKHVKKQTTLDNLSDFLIKARSPDSNIVIISTSSFFNPFDERWYVQVSYFGD